MSEKAEKYDKMFENLVVIKDCQEFEGCSTLYFPTENSCVSVCNRTGKISRPLTEEEKTFLVTQIVSEIEAGRVVYLPCNARVEVEK